MLVCRGFARVKLSLPIALVGGLMLGVCAGCGEDTGVPRVAVFGKVTLDGTPVTDGSVSMLPESEGPTANVPIKDGMYRFDKMNGPAAGAYKVLVTYSAMPPASGKVAAFQSKPNARNGEFQAQVNVPAGNEFEHNIEVKK